MKSDIAEIVQRATHMQGQSVTLERLLDAFNNGENGVAVDLARRWRGCAMDNLRTMIAIRERNPITIDADKLVTAAKTALVEVFTNSNIPKAKLRTHHEASQAVEEFVREFSQYANKACGRVRGAPE